MILWLLILLPLAPILLAPLLRFNLQVGALWAMALTLIHSFYILIIFNPYTGQFQFSFMGLGLDGISLTLVILTAFIMPICLLVEPEQAVPLLIIEALLMAVFLVLDVMVFYLCFESVLVPLFYMMGNYGGRDRRLSAALALFLYTLGGSLVMLTSIGILYLEASTTHLQALLTVPLSEKNQNMLFWGFLLAFAVKVPMIPFHLWLPEAHVEAPTGGSILLAGIILKLGTYGFLRFVLPLFPLASMSYQPIVAAVSLVGVVYAGLTALRQTDVKKIIAYSSVAHMNLAMLGIFSNNLLALEGAILMMIAHGLVSGALFYCIGALYDRHHTRLVRYYRGLASTMPAFAIFFLFFTLANVAFPGTANFMGEFLIFTGLVNQNIMVTILASSGMLLTASYSMWLYNRMMFGAPASSIDYYNDLTRMDWTVMVLLAIPTLWIGFYPNAILELVHLDTLALLI
uniref:NADH-ubiquinone oxidoreductase chain 4 n=1 Tax=Hyaloraphidium curvatum TaxID=82268 RepID=Q950T7_HYACU|nr:NADH dehydrogenase subunit 4 [Hyaloraphidium curvatum]AAK83429.1 NADH dehydrogenase subunit 4 [Hyaloraphidium curvatum]